LATLLSFAAGCVNGAGFLSFGILTTNITGHFALFAQKLVSGDDMVALCLLALVLSFLCGTSISSMVINKMGTDQRYSYLTPLLIETLILIGMSMHQHMFNLADYHNYYYGALLLFGMGLQNGTVSIISGSVVRTTHLTGMFTDLGIELGAAAGAKHKNLDVLKQRIYLRLIIITCFLSGCASGAWLFLHLHFKAFLLPATVLVAAMLFDVFRISTLRLYRSFRLRKKHAQPSALNSHAE